MEKEKKKREEEIIERERISRILEARYNRYYKEVLAEGRVPRYLMRDNLEKEGRVSKPRIKG